MSVDSPVRASDPEAATADTISPDADVGALIDQIAASYREVPWAVVRELMQNASDSIPRSQSDPGMIEYAILCRSADPGPKRYHLVFRDSGEGMVDKDFLDYVAVLGRGKKKHLHDLIGEFGVGFYATTAICSDVAIISRTDNSADFIGWRYDTERKLFVRLKADEITFLVAQDFESHPLQGRQRSHGTSVYIRLRLDEFPFCNEWLSAENALRDIRRDFSLLPAEVYVADYSESPEGRPILDGRRNDIRDESQSLVMMPWDVTSQSRGDCISTLLAGFKRRPEDDIPDTYQCFSTDISDGNVSGILWLHTNYRPGKVHLYYKRMWVEAPLDLVPAVAEPISAIIDITPGPEAFVPKVTPARDHVIRDQHYEETVKHVEDACIKFLEEAARSTVDGIVPDLARLGSKTGEKLTAVSDALATSAFFSAYGQKHLILDALLTDIPAVLKAITVEQDCPVPIREAIRTFIEDHLKSNAPESECLEHLQEHADEEHQRARAAAQRTPTAWNPRISKDFVRRVGPYLPIRMIIRDRHRTGLSAYPSLLVPLSLAPYIEPSCSQVLQILVRGRANDYLDNHPEVGILGLPYDSERSPERRNSIILLAAAIQHLKSSDSSLPPLEFVEFIRDQFTDIQTPESWEQVVAQFDTIANGHDGGGRQEVIAVHARGYQGNDAVPLLISSHAESRTLTINAYNELMLSTKATLAEAVKSNNKRVVEIISGICHELYHHALPQDSDDDGLDLHALQTRNDLFKAFLAMMGRYSDLRS